MNQTAILANSVTPGAVHAIAYEIDLNAIKKRLVRRTGWSTNRADVAETGYRAFLTECLMVPDHGVDVKDADVDEFWHMHVIDTKAYARDCQEIFGHFLHHVPCDPDSGKIEQGKCGTICCGAADAPPPH